MLTRIHDLLEIDAERFLGTQSPPLWVAASLRQTPFVVVRRGSSSTQKISVGIRGAQRSERWAGSCDTDVVKRVLTAEWLLGRPASRSRCADIPALRSVALLAERWEHMDFPWGPGGSVGFELATGREVARAHSDLDIVIYAARRMTPGEAQGYWESAQALPAAVDIRIEAPTCGFSLREYASRTPAPILLRTATGAVLGNDPWAVTANDATPDVAAPL